MNAFAVIHPGLEHVVVTELAGAGVRAEPVPGGARFECDALKLSALAHSLRTPSQLLLELGEGSARTPDQLTGLVRRLPWRSLLHPQASVEASVNAKGSALRFKEAAARNVTTAIRESLKGPFVPDRGLRPRLVQRVQVRIVDDFVTVSLDAGGDLLHRRGWREEAGKAPIRENLAACMLSLAGWSGNEVLLDPFCGAGTIPIEAALLALGRSPFVRRSLACDEWVVPPGTKRPPSSNLPKGQASARKPPPGARTPPQGGSNYGGKPAQAATPFPIYGSDHHGASVATASGNAKKAGVSVYFSQGDVRDLVPPAERGTIVTNPPYGERLGERVDATYVTFGHTLRDRFSGWRIVFLATHPEMAAKVDRRAQRLVHFKNGGIPVGVFLLEV